MLSLFPQLLFLSPLSATFIRVVLAIVLFTLARKHFSTTTTLVYLGVIEVTLAILLVLGAWTQALAIGAIIILIIVFFSRPRALPASTLALSFVLALSLIVTGAGAWAFDWPL